MYLEQNEFTPDGRKLVFTSPTGLYTVDLQTRAIEQIRTGRTGLICVGRKTGQAYYMSRGEQGFAIWAVDPNTKRDRKIVDVPRGLSIANINCDETLEPNVQFTPDGKWIVFRSNMFGPSHVFEVEVAGAKP